jgi:putative transposase
MTLPQNSNTQRAKNERRREAKLKERNERQAERKREIAKMKKKSEKDAARQRDQAETKREEEDEQRKRYFFRDVKLASKPKAEMFGRDFRIVYKFGVFYLMLTRRVLLSDRPKAGASGSVIAIDPGIRKFATVYSPEGEVTIIGTNTGKVIDKCIRRIDRTKRALAKESKRFSKHRLRDMFDHREVPRLTKKSRRHRLWSARKKYRRAELKAQRFVRDAHYKVSHKLCRQACDIILPTFNGHSIVQGSLHASVKRRCQMLAFGKFKSRLVETSTFYPGRRVISGSEAYTSKQCGVCGVLNDDLGSSETFSCGKCGLEADRDVHASRNILLRFLENIMGCTVQP